MFQSAEVNQLPKIEKEERLFHSLAQDTTAIFVINWRERVRSTVTWQHNLIGWLLWQESDWWWKNLLQTSLQQVYGISSTIASIFHVCLFAIFFLYSPAKPNYIGYLWEADIWVYQPIFTEIFQRQTFIASLCKTRFQNVRFWSLNLISQQDIEFWGTIFPFQNK